MDKIKKVYIDSRYKTNDSVSNSDFKFEIKEALDLPDNTVCFIDDICIPHTWYTIENYNNKLYIETTNNSVATHTVITIPNGNYTATSLASTLTNSLQTRFPEHGFSCGYNSNVGTIKITNSTNSEFRILTDATVVSLQGIDWYDGFNNIYSVITNNLQTINEVFRNSVQYPSGTSYESGFIDLLNVHNIYIHSPNIGNYNSMGVRGENTIIKKVPVSSSFGYLIIDSVVTQHDKIDVSRQLIKTMEFSFRNVHGDIIDLHGGHVSLSLVFQTME